jgi:outer membrane protein TolC
MNMSRKQCITEALRSNLDIKISRIGPLIAEANVMRTWGAYDPLFTGNISASGNKGAPSPFDVQQVLFGERTEGVQGQLGVGGNLPTGTAYDLTYDSMRQRYYSKDPIYDDYGEIVGFDRSSSSAVDGGNIALQLMQSLLRGRGLDVNMTQIRVAAKSKNVSECDLMLVVMQTVSAVQSAYWELVFARENLEVKKKSLAVATDLLDRNRRSHAIGTLARFLVDEAEAGVAVRKADIIAAQTTVRDAEDLLKQVMNMPDTDRYWTAEVVPADQAEVVERIVDLDEEIRLAREPCPEATSGRIRTVCRARFLSVTAWPKHSEYPTNTV